jgi:hypothetical protein
MSELIPLGEVTKALHDIGYEVTYAYDDLVFIEHSPFILRIDLEKTRTVYFYAHNTFKPAKKKKYLTSVQKKFKSMSFTIVDSGTFNLKESENKENNIDIEFYEKG